MRERDFPILWDDDREFTVDELFDDDDMDIYFSRENHAPSDDWPDET